MSIAFQRWLILVILIVLVGCSQGPEVTPTEAAVPDLGDHLLFSEVLAGVDGNNLYDFIELYNPGSEIIDLQGYSLWYLLKEGDEETLVHVWDETTLVPPLGHYLIGNQGEDFGIVIDLAVKQPLQPQRGGLILKDISRNVVDSLGWGNAPQLAVEGQSASAMENGISLERNPGSDAGNYGDTDSNDQDFALNPEPNPQNTGSPVVPQSFEQIGFSIDAPQSASPGDIVEITLRLENTTAAALENTSAYLTIPDELVIAGADDGVQVEGQAVRWTIASLGAGEKAEAKITANAPLSYTNLMIHSYYAQAETLSLPTIGAPVAISIEGGSIPIDIARNLFDQEVVIEGIATMYTGGLYAGSGAKFYMTDGTAGVQVYVAGAGNTLRVNIGDRVRVQGMVTPYRGAIEVVPSNESLVEVLERKVEEAPPVPVSIPEIIAQSENLKGTLLQVDGTLARVEEFNYSYELDIFDQDGKLVTAYLDKNTGITIETITSGDNYRVTGILEGLDNNIRLYPRQQSDLVKIYPETLLITAGAPISIAPGEPFEITLTVTNHMKETAENLTVTSPVPEGVDILDIGQGGVLDGGQILWEIESIPGGGDSTSLAYTVQPVTSTSSVTIEGYTVTAPEADPVSGESTYTFTTGTVPIWAIQGSGFRSPYNLQTVDTVGTITGVFPELNGFWMQEAATDTDPATSAGIFVFTAGLDFTYQVGDTVSVSGRVREAYQQTQLNVSTSDQIDLIDSGDPLPEPVQLDPPGDERESDQYYESLEGMLVSAGESVVVAPTNRYGEFAFVLQYHGRDRLYRGEENGMIIMADDGSTVVHNDQSTLPYAVSSGDLISDLTGPLSFSFGNYKIEPVAEPTINKATPTLPALDPIGEDQFSIMTWNVENLFDILDPHPSSPPLPTVSEYRLQIAKVVETILTAGLPTIIGVQEVENVGILEDIADHELIRQYGYIPVLIEGTDSRGIDVGYLVRGDRAEVIGEAQFPAPEEITSRPPLLVSVKLKGLETVIHVLNNHFTSMSGGEAATEPRRNAQAAWNVSVMDEILEESPDGLLAVIGDLNSFYDSLPIQTLRDGGLVHTFDLLPAEERYTYVFEGVSQTLDHILVTPSFEPYISDVVVLHLNADYAIPPAGDDSAVHKSDHDPVVVIFTLP